MRQLNYSDFRDSPTDPNEGYIGCPHCGYSYYPEDFEYEKAISLDNTMENQSYFDIACPQCGKKMDILVESEIVHTFWTRRAQ